MCRALLLLLVGLFLAAGEAAGPGPGDGEHQDDWMRRLIAAGEDVDFNKLCGTEALDPRTPDDPRWAANCRAVSAVMLRGLLAAPWLADGAPHGIRLRGARIDGTLNLDDIHIRAAEFTLIGSSLAGDLILSGAHMDGWLVLRGSVISGQIDASGSKFDGAILVDDKTLLVGKLNLVASTVASFLSFQQAKLVGGMNANSLHAGGIVQFADSEVQSDVEMDSVTLDRFLAIVGTKFTRGARLIAPAAQIGGGVVLQNSAFSGDVVIGAAIVSQPVALADVRFAAGKKLNAIGLQVNGALGVGKTDFGAGLALTNARIRDNLALSDVTFGTDGQLTGNGLQTGGSILVVSPMEVPGGIELDHARIGGDVQMAQVRTGVGKRFGATGIQVGGKVLLTDATFGGDVQLDGSGIRGTLILDRSTITHPGALSVEALRVEQDCFMRNVHYERPIDAISLAVGGSLDLRGSTLGGIDLSGAMIGGDLRLGGADNNGTQAWTKFVATDGTKPPVVLRNTKAGALQDEEHSWEGAELMLEGFTYMHLGGVGGTSRADMRNRPVTVWQDWLLLDPIYSPQPYTELASVLAASGNRGAATAIRFIGRDRERAEMVAHCRILASTASAESLRQCDVLGWIGLSILQATVGYGIGTYTFRALWWTIGLALIGTVMLAFAPGIRGAVRSDGARERRQKPLIWCFGASLSHVLPVVTLSPEFTDFFNDPKRERLYAWQQIGFAVLALCGWGLSLFVVAAFSGLTQS